MSWQEHRMVVDCQPYAPGTFTPRNYSLYSFLLEAECDRKDFMTMKNPLTPAGIEPATFQFVAQQINHCTTAVPHLYPMVWLNSCSVKAVCFLGLNARTGLAFYTKQHSQLRREYTKQRLVLLVRPPVWGQYYLCYSAVHIMSVILAERWIFSSQKCIITPIIRKIFYLYLGCLTGDQDKGWALYRGGQK